MKRMIRRIWQGLTVRLWLMVCITVVPLILGMIILTGVLVGNMSREQDELRQRELNLAMALLENGLERIDTEMDAVVLKYMTPLTVPNGADTMVSYEMIGELSDLMRETALPGIVSVQEKSGNRLYTKFTEGDYAIEVAENIRQALEKNIIYSTGGWRIRNIAGYYFYLRNYQFDNYCLTFRVDLGKCLSALLFDTGLTEDDVYFTDGMSILHITPDQIVTVISQNWNALKASAGDALLEWQTDQENCRLILGGRGHLSERGLFWLWIVLVIAVCIILFLTLWWMLHHMVLRPLHVLQGGMKRLEQDEFTYRIDYGKNRESSEFIYIYEAFNHMAEEISISHEKDIKMYQAQLDNLRLQVNPHMLLNSFNMIYSLAQTKNYECIQEFSIHLVEYFRYVLKADAMVPLYKEIQFVESYTGIQRIRFPGAFTSVYNIQEDLKNVLVPPLLIQNFVENSMKYALIPGKTIEVLINVRSEDDRLMISICDTGSGFKPEVLEKIRSGEAYVDARGQKHIGIWNCRRRMEVFYGDSAKMKIVSERGQGTQIWLDLPLTLDGGMKDEINGRG